MGGLSGGEKRRTNVAVELVITPAVLFLDGQLTLTPSTSYSLLPYLPSLPFCHYDAEPTTGLDSHTALSVMQCLKRLTRSSAVEEKREERDVTSIPSLVTTPPVTVVLSIHQPSHELFDLFDDLILLSGGHVLYCGPSSSALSYFHSLGLVCPLYTNPPEWLLDLAQGLIEEEGGTVESLVKSYQHHLTQLPQVDAEAHRSPFIAQPFRPLPFRLQLPHLLHRSHLCVSRSPLLKIAQVLQSLVLGLLIGVSFFHLGYSQSSVQNRLGALYFIILTLVFASTFSVVLTFAEERAVFIREQRGGMYWVSAYFVARTLVDVLPTLVCSLVFVCVSYFLMGLAMSGFQFAYFLLIVLLIAYCGHSMGMVVACAVSDRLSAMILTPLSIAPFIVFTPYALPYPNSVPVYLLPFQYASPFWWAFSGLAANEMQGLLFTCDARDQIHVGPIHGLGQYRHTLADTR